MDRNCPILARADLRLITLWHKGRASTAPCLRESGPTSKSLHEGVLAEHLPQGVAAGQASNVLTDSRYSSAGSDRFLVAPVPYRAQGKFAALQRHFSNGLGGRCSLARLDGHAGTQQNCHRTVRVRGLSRQHRALRTVAQIVSPKTHCANHRWGRSTSCAGQGLRQRNASGRNRWRGTQRRRASQASRVTAECPQTFTDESTRSSTLADNEIAFLNEQRIGRLAASAPRADRLSCPPPFTSMSIKGVLGVSADNLPDRRQSGYTSTASGPVDMWRSWLVIS